MRFFFDFTEGEHTTRDKDGHECTSPEQARTKALRALPEVLLDNAQNADDRQVTCSVRDEGGTVLYRASATLKGQSFSNR